MFGLISLLEPFFILLKIRGKIGLGNFTYKITILPLIFTIKKITIYISNPGERASIGPHSKLRKHQMVKTSNLWEVFTTFLNARCCFIQVRMPERCERRDTANTNFSILILSLFIIYVYLFQAD